MGRNVPIVVTSCIVVTLFVLLVFPAIIPINAPPILKTFKDIFIAVLAVAFTLMSLELMIFAKNELCAEAIEVSDDLCSRHCTLRC
jgi:uncharacterized Tic20 family protein